ncbi:MAG: hypothetical protein ACR2FU_00490 [Streptosporangiaceae bacterium]
MFTTSQLAGPPDGEPRPPSRAAAPGSGLLASLATLAGGLILGLVAGLAWTALAPRAVYVVVGRGSANVVNPETAAFISADAWYCLIGAVGGIIIGVAGYLLAVRRHGPAPMAAVLAGAVVAGMAARVIGERHGLGPFNHQLLTSKTGTLLHAPLSLAGDPSAVFWPTKASLPAVAFWPLAACLVAGGIVLIGLLRDRSAARYEGPHDALTPYPS